MLSSTRNNWLTLGKLYLFFFYFSGVYQLIILIGGAAGAVGLRQSIYMSFLWLIPILLWPRCTRVFTAISGVIFWLISLLSLGYFAIYQQEFSQSVIFVMFETNNAEGGEFVRQYYQWWMIPAAIIYGLPPLWLWFKLQEPKLPFKKSALLAALFLCITIIYPVISPVIQGNDWNKGIKHLQTRMEPATPWQLVMGYIKYKHTLSEMATLLTQNSKLPPIQNLRDSNADKNTTHVLVIGESTNRQRLSLYGYNRETSPRLSAIKDQLLIFNNVFSPRPYTIEVLQQALTFADQNNPDLYLTKPNLLNIMKQAGYKIFWITNQQTMTNRNTMLTTLSRQADEQVYLNNNRSQNSHSYDEVVINPFEKALSDSAQKKFIVIHLIGTHMGYDYRYPKEFDHFTTRDGTPDWLSNTQAKVYNEYDNAVLYNDYVIDSLISKFRGTNPHGLLLYFSDHGEEVFDFKDRQFDGRSEGNPSSAMYTVPFMVWMSPSWKADHNADNFKEYVNRPYSTSYFIHTWSDLVGIHYDGWEAGKSIVNKQFSSPPILIGNPDNKNKKLKDVRDLGWVK